MKKTLVASVLLLVCALWVNAQQSSPSSSTSPSSQSQSSQASPSDSSGSNQTVQGCLSQSGSNFVLKADSGTTYQLSGDTSQLGAHVGHEVQITGSTAQPQPSAAAGSAGSSSGASSSSSDNQQTLTVSGLKHISNTCSSGDNSQPK